MLEFKIDDIVDWLWEEMQLPNLKARVGPADDDDWMREGWDRRGARSRLDRRRSLKEIGQAPRQSRALRLRFTDEDLRYRQLARRKQPATQAVVFFMLDVSGSMCERDRKLAKSFFFWAVQGLRRRVPASLEMVFVAHTTEAWEFAEPEFFQVSGLRRHRCMSTALTKVREIIDERYSPAACNIYLFYASDGDNSPQRQRRARTSRSRGCWTTCYTRLSSKCRSGLSTAARRRETGRLFLAARCRRARGRQLRVERLRRHLGRRAALLHGRATGGVRALP